MTTSTANLAANATTITINGLGFDTDAPPITRSLQRRGGRHGHCGDPTSLTVTFSTKPTTAGSLTAVVTTDS